MEKEEVKEEPLYMRAREREWTGYLLERVETVTVRCP